LLFLAGRLAIALSTITLLGLLTSATFSVVMGLSGGFASDSVVDWFQWGVRSLVAPVVYMSVAFAGWMAVSGSARLLVRISSTARMVSERLRQKLRDIRSDGGLDDGELLLQVVIGTGVVALAAIMFIFGDCFAPVTLYITSASVDALAALRPENEGRFDQYGRTLDMFVLVYGLVIIKAFKAAYAGGHVVGRATRVMAWILPALALMFWAMPYRLVYHNAFTRVDLAGTRCYEIGKSGAALLLHCPDIQPPRNRIVQERDPDLMPRGVIESVFTPPPLHPTR